MSNVVRTSELERTGGRNTFSGGAGHACTCITCGDEAVSMRVREIDGDRGLALCETGDGSRSSVETALVEPVVVGDVLLVHAGTAIAHGATYAGDDGRSEAG